MKKVLTLALALVLAVSMCTFSVLADDPAEPDGSLENPYLVSTPMMAPSMEEIPAGTTVYYSFSSMFFDGLTMEVYGMTEVTLDGVPYTAENELSPILVEMNATSLNDFLVGFTNGSEDVCYAMISYLQPVGTMDNPYELTNGENTLSVDAGVADYYGVFVPEVNGDLSLVFNSDDAAYAVEVIVGYDGTPTVYEFEDSDTITLDAFAVESWVPVFFTFYNATMAFDAYEANVVVNMEEAPLGSEENPIGVYDPEQLVGENTIETAGDSVYYNFSMGFNGVDLVVTGNADTVVYMNGTAYEADENGVVTVPLVMNDNWQLEVVVENGGDSALTYTMEALFSLGSYNNPQELFDGENEVEIPEGCESGYFAYYVVTEDGTLTITTEENEALGDVILNNPETWESAWMSDSILAGEGYTVSMEVTAGQVIDVQVAVMPDENWNYPALNITLNVNDTEEESSTPEDESSSTPEDESSSAPEDESSSAPEDESSSVPEDESSSSVEDESTSIPDTGVIGGMGAGLVAVLVSGAFVLLQAKKRD